MKEPQKCHIFIVEFSKDHHYALLLVWKIKQGLKNAVAIERIKGYVKLFAEIDLFPHFDQEEKFLLPLLSSKDLLRKRVETEHCHLRESLHNIFENKCSSVELQNFAVLLENHIRFEEREFFPYLQRVINLDSLDYSENKKNRNQNTIDEIWIDNFWEIRPVK